MHINRLIPILLLNNESLVKTARFNNFSYIGDPCNTVRIFNELEVDELLFLDINSSREGRAPNLSILSDIANECFMPLGYGGGIKDSEEAKKIFDIGFEKVSINTNAFLKPHLITDIAKIFGSQSLVVSIDYKKNLFGKYSVYIKSGRKNIKLHPLDWAKEVENRGAGEILLTSINKEGTWSGLDLELIDQVVDAVNIPVIAHGGVGSVDHINNALSNQSLSAVGLGSLVVFQKKDMGVLVNFPDRSKIIKKLV
jgi:imidazole glycerol-phosphate synthase subunit HisF